MLGTIRYSNLQTQPVMVQSIIAMLATTLINSCLMVVRLLHFC